MPDTRARAIAGLRLIAQVEEHVAEEIDEPGYFGRLAQVLRQSATKRRRAADGLGEPPPTRPHLRLVV